MTELDTKTVIVPLERIVTSERFQARGKGTDFGTVKRYATAIQSGAQFPPVLLGLINGTYFCLDGFHRLEAHRRAEKGAVEAVVVSTDEKQAAWLAAKANLTHGLPLKAAEWREAFKRYVKAGQHRKQNGRYKSYREIQEGLGGGKAHTTIRNWMEKDFPTIYRLIGGSEGHVDHRAPKPPIETTPLEHTRAALMDARNHMAGITDPIDRDALAEEIKVVISELITGDAWEPQEPPPF